MSLQQLDVAGQGQTRSELRNGEEQRSARAESKGQKVEESRRKEDDWKWTYGIPPHFRPRAPIINLLIQHPRYIRQHFLLDARKCRKRLLVEGAKKELAELGHGDEAGGGSGEDGGGFLIGDGSGVVVGL